MLYNYIKSKMKQYPDQIVSDNTRTITYNQMILEAENIGSKLSQNVYLILCKSELNTAISLLACLFANKISVPLSARYGENHYKKIIEYIHPNCIITDENINFIHSNRDSALSDVSFIMCSSGTTGEPKGIMLTERNVFSNIIDIEKYMPIDAADYMLISRPIYHCAVMTSELLYGLTKGVRILFYSDNLNPKKLFRIIDSEGITVTSATPTIFYYLSKYINSLNLRCCLKTIAISGECLTKSVAKEISNALPDTKIFNVYGLTEASPRVSYLPYDLFKSHPTSVGIPLSSVNIKIIEDELCVNAPSVMKGYYKNDTLTDKVIDNGWLHTGDIAEIKDGLLYIKCRKDNMIIRAGMNIYPQEIENILKLDSKISDVLVYGEKDNVLGEKICINVISELGKSDIFEICRKNLPAYQLPDRINIVDKLEYNPSGKLIRRRIKND